MSKDFNIIFQYFIIFILLIKFEYSKTASCIYSEKGRWCDNDSDIACPSSPAVLLKNCLFYTGKLE